MIKLRRLRLPLFLTALLTLAGSASADQFYEEFSAFTGLQISLAIDGNIVPSPDNKTYDMSLLGPKELVDAIQASVTAGKLSVGLKPGSSIAVDGSAANFTIRTPTGVLQAVTTSDSGSLEANGRVLSAQQLQLSTAGAGLTSLVEVPTPAVTVQASGAGTLVLEGEDLVTLALTMDGSGIAYFSGLSGKATVGVSGTCSVYFVTQGSTAQIVGNVLGASKIYYDGGRCSIIGFGSGSTCVRGTIVLPF